MGSSDPKAIVSQAQEAENRGEAKRASGLYAMAGIAMAKEHRYRDARALFRKAIGLSPESGRLYIQLALVENSLGNDEAAIRSMEKFTQVTLRRNRWEEYRPYFDKHLAEMPTLRQVFYQGQLELDRTDAGPFLAFAQAAADKGDWETARDRLVDALKTKSRRDEVAGKLADVLRAMGDSEGEKNLESFLASRLKVGELAALLAKRPRRAETSAPAAAAPAPEEDLDGLIRRLESDLGVDLQERHDNVRPLVNEFRRRSDKVIGSDTQTRIDLALSFFEMGLPSDARDELGKVGARDPLYLQAQALLGEILTAEGSLLEALEAYQRCLRDERAQGDLRSEATYRLAQIYEKLGDEGLALKYAADLEARSPTYRDIRQLKKGIEERLRARGKRPRE